jgi:CubicO group peptidase (beta-lactamase class C family)
MTLGHLLTMTGGHFCDDSNPEAPGNEDAMQEQERERDWYRYILAVPMDRTPGEKLVYCSIDAHLAGGVLAKVAGRAAAGALRPAHRAPAADAPVPHLPGAPPARATWAAARSSCRATS